MIYQTMKTLIILQKNKLLYATQISKLNNKTYNKLASLSKKFYGYNVKLKPTSFDAGVVTFIICDDNE